ncbi:Oidioi.mRNA.OKI2018_I69.PAR.g8794.t1.cds [Oikopleura dioica]|uniref:Oidioi.mRNA.OKI2018_I69.PAR.g8794.t1.cds n=1 Tax=Oikopleura dioica TaxID=34765 RepID=A0ABN7RM39_OIKDI|nr:Oidioi.mRNA.OKI2018_I69.PAR.g8794.t1.cds [Oikopleura dioica]
MREAIFFAKQLNRTLSLPPILKKIVLGQSSKRLSMPLDILLDPYLLKNQSGLKFLDWRLLKKTCGGKFDSFFIMHQNFNCRSTRQDLWDKFLRLIDFDLEANPFPKIRKDGECWIENALPIEKRKNYLASNGERVKVDFKTEAKCVLLAYPFENVEFLRMIRSERKDLWDDYQLLNKTINSTQLPNYLKKEVSKSLIEHQRQEFTCIEWRKKFETTDLQKFSEILKKRPFFVKNPDKIEETELEKIFGENLLKENLVERIMEKNYNCTEFVEHDDVLRHLIEHEICSRANDQESPNEKIGSSSDSYLSFAGNETCPDQDLYDECYSLCRFDYLQCRANCDNSLCENECLIEFTESSSSCPCGVYCSDGCSGCKHELCGDEPQTTAEATIITTTAITTTIDPNDPRNMNIFVLGFEYLADSYIFSGNGMTKNSATITPNFNNYAGYCPYAFVQGELYLFGGVRDKHRIMKLQDCSFNELSIRLINGFTSDDGSAIQIENGQKAMVCFSATNWRNCEIFDTSSSVTTHSTRFTHWSGSLGYYRGQPTTVGSYEPSGFQKVETYSFSGWQNLPDHPRNTYRHTLIGLESGAMLMLGGLDETIFTYSLEIWLLDTKTQNDRYWRLIGSLKKFVSFGSALKIGDFIYLVIGYNSANGVYPIERINIVNDIIVDTEVIGGHDFRSFYPVIFETTADFCV